MNTASHIKDTMAPTRRKLNETLMSANWVQILVSLKIYWCMIIINTFYIKQTLQVHILSYVKKKTTNHGIFNAIGKKNYPKEMYDNGEYHELVVYLAHTETSFFFLFFFYNVHVAQHDIYFRGMHKNIY